MPKRKKSSAYKTGFQNAAGAEAYERSKARKRAAANIRNHYYSRRGTPANIDLFGADWATASDEQKLMRKKIGYKGAGDYKSYLKYLPRAFGAGIGQLTGHGLQKGWDVGADLSRYFGWGDYQANADKMERNQIIEGSTPSQMKISVNDTSLSGDIVFQHTEFVKNVIVPGSSTGVSPFHVEAYSLNPGQDSVFPFLSSIANNFEMYEFHGLIFGYKPLSGESANATNQLGKVMMCTNYDPASLPFRGSHELENYAYASSAKPACGQHHGVETALSQRLTNQLYVRNSNFPPGPSPPNAKDKMLTDLGLFQLATEGIPVGSDPEIIGELWVTYMVKLSRPQISSLMNNEESEYTKTMLTTTSSNSVFQSVQVDELSGTLGCTVVPVNQGADVFIPIQFPVGTRGAYKVSYVGTLGGPESINFHVENLTVVPYPPIDTAAATTPLRVASATTITTSHFIDSMSDTGNPDWIRRSATLVVNLDNPPNMTTPSVVNVVLATQGDAQAKFAIVVERINSLTY